MKIAKFLLPLLSVFMLIFALCGCSRIDKTDVEAVVTNELDLLKNLDSDTTQKYVSYTELFPGVDTDSKLSREIKKVFTLFFQDFDYTIQNIDVAKDNSSATASVLINVIDAGTLAKDYAAAQLKSDINKASEHEAGSDEEASASTSLEDRYLILGDLLKENTYETVERECTFTMDNAGSEKKPEWEVIHTSALENDLVGGFIMDLSDSNLLSPEETLTIYLSTLKDMDTEHMGNYLGIESLTKTDDATKNSIASALVEKVHECFDFSVTGSSIQSYSATVDAEITTFDSDAIMTAYQAELDEYLGTVDAVIDGADTRYEKSLDMLLSHIKDSTDTVVSTATFKLTNDGTSWKLEDSGSAVGTAIFGSLSSTNVSDETSDDTDSENSGEDSLENSSEEDSSDEDSSNDDSSDDDSSDDDSSDETYDEDDSNDSSADDSSDE